MRQPPREECEHSGGQAHEQTDGLRSPEPLHPGVQERCQPALDDPRLARRRERVGVNSWNPVEERQSTRGQMGEEPIVGEGRQPDGQTPEPEESADDSCERGRQAQTLTTCVRTARVRLVGHR